MTELPNASESKPKECFVICPIGPADSDIRKRANQVFEHVIKPVVEPCGYVTTRGDTLEYSGQISTQVIEKIFDVDLVIADLTNQNANVFYELALRHAAKKPFIHIVAIGEKIPFDLQGWRAITFDHRDLDLVHDAKEQLAAHVDYIEQGNIVESPVTYTLNWQQLKESDKREERGLADLMEEVRELQYLLRGTAETVYLLRDTVDTVSDFGRFVNKFRSSMLELGDRSSGIDRFNQSVSMLVDHMRSWDAANPNESAISVAERRLWRRLMKLARMEQDDKEGDGQEES